MPEGFGLNQVEQFRRAFGRVIIRVTTSLLALACVNVPLYAISAPLTSPESSLPEASAGRIRVFYQPGLELVARELAPKAQAVLRNLEATFEWPAGPSVEILLVGDSARFAELVVAGDLFTGVASAQQNQIVLDIQKLAGSPYGVEETLHHELVHIVLGQHIPSGNLPRWFNEGVAQLLSGGVSEFPASADANALRTAALAGRLLPFSGLTSGFPADPQTLRLAYGQSLSLTTYMEKRFGRAKFLSISQNLAQGLSFTQACASATGMEFRAIETEWRQGMVQKAGWAAYLADRLYWIIFFAGAVLTLMGFLRLRRRMHRLEEEWEESGEPEESGIETDGPDNGPAG